jgi:hypothetical protein
LKGEPSTFDMPMLVAGLATAVLTLWLLFAGGHGAMFGADPLARFI